MSQLHAITTQTPIGEFYMIARRNQNDEDVIYASGFGVLEDLVKRVPANLQNEQLVTVKTHPYQKWVKAYFAKDKQALTNIPISQEGSSFSQKVWQVMGKVGFGQTISYKQLATASGSPDAVRAAGSTCARNRLILLVPCHRILKSDGSIGSYLYGSKVKKYLLEHEDSLG